MHLSFCFCNNSIVVKVYIPYNTFLISEELPSFTPPPLLQYDSCVFEKNVNALVFRSVIL